MALEECHEREADEDEGTNDTRRLGYSHDGTPSPFDETAKDILACTRTLGIWWWSGFGRVTEQVGVYSVYYEVQYREPCSIEGDEAGILPKVAEMVVSSKRSRTLNVGDVPGRHDKTLWSMGGEGREEVDTSCQVRVIYNGTQRLARQSTHKRG